MCLKIRYLTRRLAEINATIQARKFGKLPMRAYPCYRCKGFHLTSDNDPRKRVPGIRAVVFVPADPDPPPAKPLPPPPERQLEANRWYERHRKALKSKKRFLKPQ